MSNKTYLYLLLLGVIISFLAGCGGSSSTTVIIPTATPLPSATATPTSGQTGVVLPDRETTVSTGQASVTFQTGSVTRQVTCTASVTGITPSLPLGVQTASSVYSFSLSDVTAYNVALPAYVTLPVTLTPSILPEDVTVFHSSDGITWNNIGGTLTGETISANVPSFSFFVATIPLVGPTSTPTPGTGGNKIFFLHHSVGNDLIERGNVRGTINTYNSSHGTGYQFWDHGYNGDGLRDSSGNFTGTNYAIPGDNTDPDGLSYLFTSSGADAVSARNQIMTYNMIAFKSCFTASQALVDDDTLNNYKNYYLQMRNYFDAHPEKVFVVITPPPSHPDETASTTAGRARQFANWLKSSEYLSGHSNIVCFDLFDYFADSNNVLKAGYRYTGEVNSHPNELGDQTVGPIFAQFLIDNAR